MSAPITSTPVLARGEASKAGTYYTEGIVSGLIGAMTIAVWFLILDTIRGRPFATPTILGTLIFKADAAVASPETIPASLEMVLAFTWIHCLVFCLLGGIASRLLALAEEKPMYGYGIILLMVLFEFGFIVLCMFVAEPLLLALTWPAVLVGNLLATTSMGIYFWRRHPNLAILP